jgi:hypothetical protein
MNMQRWIYVTGFVLGLVCAENSSAAKRTNTVVHQGRAFPSISSLSPASKIACEPGFALTVNGASFETGAVLLFNSIPCPTTVISSSQLTAAIPASDLLSAGVFSIVVSNRHGKTAGSAFLVDKADTASFVTSSSNPATLGAAVTFTATISILAPSSGTPKGSVTFKDGAVPIATSLLSGGQAVFTTAALSAGTHWITATYNGDAGCNPSTNPPLALVVGDTLTKIASATTLNSSTNPVVSGQLVTFQATVKSALPGAGPPSGTVTFKEGDTSLGTRTLQAGQAAFTTAALPVGPHSISAVYNGDDYFNASTAAALTQTVHQCSSAVAVASSANPSVSGQWVTFTASVSAIAPGSGTPSGIITFKDGATILGSGTLSSGQATYTLPTLAVGPHSISAAFSGDTSFIAKISAPFAQTINKASSTTALAASPNPSVTGQPVTFTASVSAVAPGSGTPAGTVTFKDGAVSLGTASLISGQASLTIASLSSATHSITAGYNGDGNFFASTSATLSETINSIRPSPAGALSAKTSSFALTSATAPVITSISPLIDGNMGLLISGSPGQQCFIQATADLQTWTSIATNLVDGDGMLFFVDTDSTNYTSRFYRTGSF